MTFGWISIEAYSMKDVERIADDAYVIKQPMREDWYVGILVFIGKDKIGLIDSGFERTPSEYIFPLVKELGRSLDEIDYLVNTHRDGDHIQGNRAIRGNTRAKIATHELEVEAIQDVEVKLKDGDTVELGDRQFEVIHTPGHRPGAICLYESKNQFLVSGDSVCGERSDLIRMDRGVYMASINKLLSFDIRLLVMGHPFKPLGKAILTGNEPKRMLEASISVAQKM